jgi:N-acetylglucosamine malate deacetylase 2
VSHAVVKRVFSKLKKEGGAYPKRLAFFTRMGEFITDGKFRLEISNDDEIAFIETCSEEDMVKFREALIVMKPIRK